MLRPQKLAFARRFCRIGLILAMGMFCAARAQAEAISYSLMLCESLDVLRDPMNKTLAMNVAWVPQHTLMLERTMPYFELRNTSEEAVITQFSMTIGDTSKNYDWGQLIESSPGVMFSLITPDGMPGGAKADTLVISFNGLGPGEFVRFRAGLSPDDSNASMVLDYRMVLFNMNGNDPSSNSVVTVDFQSAAGDESLVNQFPNFAMNMPTSTSLAFPHHYMDMVMPFQLGDSGTIPPIPEPGSLVLLGSGLLGLAAWRLRRRRRP